MHRMPANDHHLIFLRTLTTQGVCRVGDRRWSVDRMNGDLLAPVCSAHLLCDVARICNNAGLTTIGWKVHGHDEVVRVQRVDTDIVLAIFQGVHCSNKGTGAKLAAKSGLLHDLVDAAIRSVSIGADVHVWHVHWINMRNVAV